MHLKATALIPAFLCAALLSAPLSARAATRFCDPAYENCRSPLLSLIRAETVGIDVAFWFMEDTTLASALIARWQAGVPVRVLLDTRAVTQYGYDDALRPIQMLRDAGVPIRRKSTGGILHWKMMLFAGQDTVQFSAANYSSEAFAYSTPYSNYIDEVIYFTDKASIIGSFKTRYDDVWTSTSGYASYANVTELHRYYPTFAMDPELNFVPWQNFRSRSVANYKAETAAIDSIMYRVTDRAHTDQMIAAHNRGVRVRILAEPQEYRNPGKLWVSWNLDRMYMAGIALRFRQHAGLLHEKLTLLHGKRMTIFGSSNWTSASAESQLEHNLFTLDAAFYAWGVDHFNRKWNNTGPSAESKPFAPLPPGTPVLRSPASGATGIGQSVTLSWDGGTWAHKYDVYVGTSTSSLVRVLTDRELGPGRQSWPVSGLASGTTYYWRVVGRTMANLERTSANRSFTTAGGTTPTEPPPSSLPSGWATGDIGSVAAAGNATYSSGIFTLDGSGADIWGSADEFRFAYQAMSGDGSIVARVRSVEYVDAWTKAGVMIRESLSAGSRHAAVFVSPGKGIAFQRRASTSGSSTHTSGGAGTAPRWVRLVRTGSTFTASSSTDGSTWTTIGSATISMAASVYVGLPLTSHRDGSVATATFDNVRITP